MRISRPAVWLIGALALGFAVITALKQSPTASEPAPQMSSGRKAEIDQFWSMYRQASDLRLAGDLEGAAAAYRKALHLNNRHEDALYYLGNTLFQLEIYDEALVVFRRLVEVNPLSARAHFQAGAILSCALPGVPFDLDAAEQEFLRTLEINQEESEPLVRLGEVAVAKGNFAQAETYLTHAMRLNGKAVMACYLHGYLRWRMGDRAAAADLLRTAYEHSRAEQPAHGVAGEGDTREDRRPGEGRQSLFMTYVKAGTANPDISMDDTYGRLDQFRNEIYERWRKP